MPLLYWRFYNSFLPSFVVELNFSDTCPCSWFRGKWRGRFSRTRIIDRILCSISACFRSGVCSSTDWGDGGQRLRKTKGSRQGLPIISIRLRLGTSPTAHGVSPPSSRIGIVVVFNYLFGRVPAMYQPSRVPLRLIITTPLRIDYIRMNAVRGTFSNWLITPILEGKIKSFTGFICLPFSLGKSNSALSRQRLKFMYSRFRINVYFRRSGRSAPAGATVSADRD